MTTPTVYMRNGLTGAWERARLKRCSTCGILFQTAQRTKKYCSPSCHPKRTSRSSDGYVEQHVVWVCRTCHARIAEVRLGKEKRLLDKSDYVCDECLRDQPLEVVFREERIGSNDR